MNQRTSSPVRVILADDHAIFRHGIRTVLEHVGSIDVIAAAFPYDKYVQAETILSMSQIPGDNTGAFRDSPWTKALVDELRRAQAEAEVRCF